jgi:hypothetical protein
MRQVFAALATTGMSRRRHPTQSPRSAPSARRQIRKGSQASKLRT